MVGSDGVAPPEPEGSEFTARPATNYGITPHKNYCKYSSNVIPVSLFK